MTAASGRHLSPAILVEHVESGITMLYPFPGEPAVGLLIEGAVPRLTLRAPVPSAIPSLPNSLRNVDVASTFADGRHRLEISVAGQELLLDGHAMLCAVADRIQVDGQEPLAATRETLDHWRSMLALRTRMTPEAEIGLFGELLVIEALTATHGPDLLQVWRGPKREEHDIGLKDLDVEIKSTSADQRVHWISSLDQLQPSPGRELVLLSLQLTRGGVAGRTLPQLIMALRATLDRTAFDAALADAGWEDAAADLFVDRWHLRSAPASFVVDDSFPALTRELLSMVPRETQRIRDVRYRIDLVGLPTDKVKNAVLSTTLSALQDA